MNWTLFLNQKIISARESAILNILYFKNNSYCNAFSGYGITTDGVTTYINASTCTLQYRPKNPAVIFDMPLPRGHSKSAS